MNRAGSRGGAGQSSTAPKRASVGRALAGVVGPTLGVVLVGLVLRVRPRRVVVEGHSMEPGLQPGDRLLVLRERRPRLGEIVALVDPREKARLLVKRLIEVSGDGYEVAGDNPEASTDSRAFGPVGRDALRGRAVYRYGPAGRTGPLH